jgi:integrase
MEGIPLAKKKRAVNRFWIVKNNNLYARLQYTDSEGKSKEKYRPISDKRLARAAVEEMRSELAVHGPVTLNAEKLKFEELANTYRAARLVEARYVNGVKVSGRRSLGSLFTALKALVAYFGHKAIRSINANDLESYKQKRLSTPTQHGTQRKLATVNRELELLRAMLNFAIQNEWLVRNPFRLTKGIISKAAEVERDRVLSFDEERRLLEACTGRRVHLRPLLICALDTAMRRGEIFKMVWKDVNWITNEIYIPQTNTKTEDARTVGITPRLRAELEKLWAISSKNNNSIAFGITTTVKTAFQAACNEAGIQDFRFHDCRHTATTRMVASGSPHTEVMKITGHSQIKTFLRYLNVTSETTSKVASRLNNYFLESSASSVSESINQELTC